MSPTETRPAAVRPSRLPSYLPRGSALRGTPSLVADRLGRGAAQGVGRATSRTAGAIGAALAAATRAAAKLRRDKPLHRRGVVGRGRLVVDRPWPRTEARILASPGSYRVKARWSLATSLPPPLAGLPDVAGLALRIGGAGVGGADADLLFAASGSGRITRHLLAPRPLRTHGPLSSLVPMKTRAGGFVLAIVPLGPQRQRPEMAPPETYVLRVAPVGGNWRRVGRLELSWSESDEAIRFHPIERPPAGMFWPSWVLRLRGPAYRAARAALPTLARNAHQDAHQDATDASTVQPGRRGSP